METEWDEETAETEKRERRKSAEHIMRILEDFVDVMISLRTGQHTYSSDEVVTRVLAEHRENLTQEIEKLV